MAKRKTKSIPRPQKTKPRRANLSKKHKRDVQTKRVIKKKRGRSQYRARPKIVEQKTATIANEVMRFRSTKGTRAISNTDNAKKLLTKKAREAKKKFSRKKGQKFAAKITLKWRGVDGKTKQKTLYHVSDSLESAIESLLKNDEINSLTYESQVRGEDQGVTKQKKIGGSTKRITAVSFEKRIERTRKIPKTSRKKGTKKKSRRI